MTHYCSWRVSFLFFFTQEIRQYITHSSYTNAVNLEDNPSAWWKQYGHLFLTLSRLTRRYLATPATSCPVERLFSVAGQVTSSRRANLSWDNLTLLVFMHEALPLLRKIRALKIVQEDVGVFEVVVDLDLGYEHLVTVWNRRYTILSYQCTIHWYY